MSEKVLGFQKDLLNMYFYNLDWIKIMYDAIELRPSSWYPLGGKQYQPIEWKNASDCICSAVIARINRDFNIEPRILHAKNDKESRFNLKDLLVPVVSIEALKNWVEEEQHIFRVGGTIDEHKVIYCVMTNDLLAWAEKETKGETRK